VVSYHGEASLLSVWNQRSGKLVSRQTAVDLCYIRLSPASDRMAVSVRGRTDTGSGSELSMRGGSAGNGSPELILRSADNRFLVSLSTPNCWAAE